MRITILGSSHGVPEPHRRCSCAMVQVGDRYYFVDMGMNPIEDLRTRQIPVDAVKGVFITHTHGDHVNGLVGFADLVNWYFKAADPVMLLPEQDVIDLLKQWLPTVNHGPLRELRFACYKEGVIYDDGVLKVTAIRTQHIAVSYAFLLEAEGRKVLFTGDLHHGSPTDFPEIAYSTHLDMVFCESAHFPVTEYKPIFAKCAIGKVCIQHYSPRFDSLLRGFVEEMKPLPVVIASDGTEFNL